MIEPNYSEMSFEEAKNELMNKVYTASLIFERLEGVRKVFGNGHHMAQDVARYAGELLEKRWTNRKEIK